MEERIEIEDLLFLALAKARNGWWILNGEATILVGFEWTHFQVIRLMPIAAWKYRHGLKEVDKAKGSYDENPKLESKLLNMFYHDAAFEEVQHHRD